MLAGLGAAAVSIAQAAPAEAQDFDALTLKQASDLLRAKNVSSMELVQACLKRIEAHDPALNAFITVMGDQALASAKALQAEIQVGKWRGPLHGVPIALKDNIDTAGIRTTAASQLLKDRVPSEDAEVVRRLKKAGAVILGKLNMNEFAFGRTSADTYFGTVHNPWKLDRIPGGSSSGPAAAVSAGLCFGALGTDTAGSIRMPAAFCSVVGFKPTYGRSSIRGIIPVSWTLDHVGPICRTVEDAALMLRAIAGYDEADVTTVEMPVPDYATELAMPVSKLRVGALRNPFFENLDPETAAAVEAALAVLRKLTAGVSDVEIPPVGIASRVMGAEAYAYHAQTITQSPELYLPGTRTSILASANGKAADYVLARRRLEQLRREIWSVFENVNILITPTTPEPATIIGETPKRNAGIATSPFDVYGLPAISAPCGFSSAGLPIGLQIVGAPWAESTVLALARAYERATEWHLRRPKSQG